MQRRGIDRSSKGGRRIILTWPGEGWLFSQQNRRGSIRFVRRRQIRLEFIVPTERLQTGTIRTRQASGISRDVFMRRRAGTTVVDIRRSSIGLDQHRTGMDAERQQQRQQQDRQDTARLPDNSAPVRCVQCHASVVARPFDCVEHIRFQNWFNRLNGCLNDPSYLGKRRPLTVTPYPII